MAPPHAPPLLPTTSAPTTLTPLQWAPCCPLRQVAVVVRGMESIRLLEKYSAPLLIGLSLALLGWAVTTAGGFGPMLSTPSQFGPGMAKAGQFWSVFWPAVTANVGYWATLSLNIPDFTRYAHSQRDQIMGQALGLPLFMALFTFLGMWVEWGGRVATWGVYSTYPEDLPWVKTCPDCVWFNTVPEPPARKPGLRLGAANSQHNGGSGVLASWSIRSLACRPVAACIPAAAQHVTVLFT